MVQVDKDKVYDTVVIGSGIGGLTAASLLAKSRLENVLVVEQHFKLGGLTHTFKRKGFEWDVGLHYVGEMYEGAFPKKLLDYATDSKIRWNKMPDPFEVFSYPEKSYHLYSERTKTIRELKKDFPRCADEIDNYFSDLDKATTWGSLFFSEKILPSRVSWIAKIILLFKFNWSQLTLTQYFEKHQISKNLAQVLASQCGDYGLPPSKVSFFAHANIVNHYKKGGFYPENGSRDIGDSFEKFFKEHSIDALKSQMVLSTKKVKRNLFEIVMKNQKTDELSTVYSKKVVSTVGARQSYKKFIPDPKAIAATAELPPSMPVLTVYIGFKSSPSNLGFKGENHWIFSDTEFEDVEKSHMDILKNGVQCCYLSFPSLKSNPVEKNTATLLIPIPEPVFSKWTPSQWKKRDEDYLNLKNSIGKMVIDFVDNRYPGFKDKIEYFEVSTPLSNSHFTNHFKGESYGLPAIPRRYQFRFLGPRTREKHFYLGGADVLSHGFVGALMGGFVAVTATMNLLQVIRLFRSILAKPLPSTKSELKN